MSRVGRAVVWAGGMAFVASLAFCGYRFIVSWSGDRATGIFSPRAALFNGVLFALFALHHSVFARERVKAALARRIPERLIRSVYVWTASVLLIVILVLWQPVGGTVYRFTGWQAFAHALVQVLGLWLIARSLGAIDALELAGIRRSDGGRLKVSGPYRLVRHPLYLGWVLIVSGAATMTGDRLFFAAVTSTYLIAAVPWEERSLERTFGEEYARYRRQVRWRIIPYVY